MFEDPAIESAVFRPASRVLAVASAGDTARALALAGHRVTGVDVNPAQLAYARERLAGAPYRPGRVDRLMAAGRRLQPLLGWRAAGLHGFLALNDLAQQRLAWPAFETRRFRWFTNALLSRTVLRMAYAGPLLACLPPQFGRVVRQRLRRGFARHPNAHNPWAGDLLMGEARVEVGRVENVELVCAEAAQWLETCPAHGYDAFTLSNILDGAAPGYQERLRQAVLRAAAPGAIMVLRSFACPVTQEEEEWAARDRALLWGRVQVMPVSQWKKEACATC